MEPPIGTNVGVLVPVGGSNRDKRTPTYIPLLPPLARAIQLSVLAILGSGGGVHANFLHNFVKAIDSPSITALMVRSMILLSYIVCVAHFLV